VLRVASCMLQLTTSKSRERSRSCPRTRPDSCPASGSPHLTHTCGMSYVARCMLPTHALVAPFARRTCAHCDDGFRLPTCQCARHGMGIQVCACTMCACVHTLAEWCCVCDAGSEVAPYCEQY
jgi:hypothetical protein